MGQFIFEILLELFLYFGVPAIIEAVGRLPHTGFATFHGGAAFAFGVALARLLGTG